MSKRNSVIFSALALSTLCLAIAPWIFPAISVVTATIGYLFIIVLITLSGTDTSTIEIPSSNYSAKITGNILFSIVMSSIFITCVIAAANNLSRPSSSINNHVRHNITSSSPINRPVRRDSYADAPPNNLSRPSSSINNHVRHNITSIPVRRDSYDDAPPTYINAIGQPDFDKTKQYCGAPPPSYPDDPPPSYPII